jgi:hypothetical protein
VTPLPRRTLAWISVVGLLLVGDLSAALSGPSAQRAAARWLVETVPRNRPFFLRSGDEKDPEIRKVWDSVGANYRITDPAKDGPEQFPWCSVGGAQPRLPFVTAVKYGWVRAPPVGDGGSLWYFCLFGLTIELGRTISWVT